MGDLVADARLVTAVDQERPGGERGGGAWRKSGLSGWDWRCCDRVQEVVGVGNLILRGGRLRAKRTDGLGDSVGQIDLAVELIVATGNGLQDSAGQGGDVAGQGLVGVGGIELVPLNEVGVDSLKPLGNLTGDQVLIDALFKIRHQRNLAGLGVPALSLRKCLYQLSASRQRALSMVAGACSDAG
nr:hypothetical protein [Micromonospora sp. WP24]